MTPREFAALRIRADELNMERDRLMWRHTSALLAMLGTQISGKVQDPDDFNPYAKKEALIADPQALISFVAELNRNLGGKDLRKPRLN